MLFFSKKTPEEKEAARLEKLRRKEGDRCFGGALMTPKGELQLADICLAQLHPDTETLVVHCHRKELTIPYPNLRGLTCSSEVEILRGESPITAEEMNDLLEGDAGQFVGPLNKNAGSRSRWFLRLDYVDRYGLSQSLIFIAYNMRGFYYANNKLYAATQFEETLHDIMSRYPTAHDE